MATRPDASYPSWSTPRPAGTTPTVPAGDVATLPALGNTWSSRDTNPPPEARTIEPTERPGQPGGRRDTNRKERIKAIADAGLKLFLERGIEAVSIEEITIGAGVAKGSFYRYFEDKLNLVDYLIGPVRAAVYDGFRLSTEELRDATTAEQVSASYETLSTHLVSCVLNHGDHALLYLQENRGQMAGARAPVIQLARMLAELALEHSEIAQTKGFLRPIATDVSTMAVIGAAENLLYAALSGQLKSSPLDVPRALIDLVLGGVRQP
jgi:AcrR family transcriptional regulator